MRAVVYDRYRPPDVLRLAEVELPVPEEDEVRVRICATTVTRADCATREANRRSGLAVMLLSRLISGLRRPRQRILGNQLVRSLGADWVIGYTQEDFTTNGQTYDIIFDAVGKRSFRRCKGSLSRGGIYLATDGLQNLILVLWTKLLGDKRVLFPIPPRYTKQDVLFLKQLIEAGKYRAVIDRCYPLSEVVEATRYVEVAAVAR